jgi:hypothetical protein
MDIQKFWFTGLIKLSPTFQFDFSLLNYKTNNIMSTSLEVIAFSGKENKEFKKHFNAVVFCIENELSFPKETSEFFKGKLGGDDLEDIKREYILGYIQNGVEVPLKVKETMNEIIVNVADIPSSVETIIFRITD